MAFFPLTKRGRRICLLLYIWNLLVAFTDNTTAKSTTLTNRLDKVRPYQLRKPGNSSVLRQHLKQACSSSSDQLFTVACILQSSGSNSSEFKVDCVKYHRYGAEEFSKNTSISISLHESTASCVSSDTPSGKCDMSQAVVTFSISDIVRLNETSACEDSDKSSIVTYVTVAMVAVSSLVIVIIAACLAFCKKWIDNYLSKVDETSREHQSNYGNTSSQIHSSAASQIWAETVSTDVTEDDILEETYQNLGMNAWSPYPESKSSLSVRRNKSVNESRQGNAFPAQTRHSQRYYNSYLHRRNLSESEHGQYGIMGCDNPREKLGDAYEVPSWGEISADETLKTNPVHRKKEFFKAYYTTGRLRPSARVKLPLQSNIFNNRIHKKPEEGYWVPSKDSPQTIKHKVTWTDGSNDEGATDSNRRRNQLPKIYKNDDIDYPFRNSFILSRNFTSLQNINGQTNNHGNISTTWEKCHLPNANHASRNVTMEDDVSRGSAYSLNRCSTLANANKDISRCSADSSICEDPDAFENRFNGSDIRSSFLSSVSEH